MKLLDRRSPLNLFKIYFNFVRAFLDKREFRNNFVDEKRISKRERERERGRDIHFSSTV